MNVRLAPALLLSMLFLAPLSGRAQQISSIVVQPANAAVGEPVSITVLLQETNAPAGCGLRVALGDGSFADLRADLTTMPIRLSHVYSRDGQFTVRAAGRTYVRGLKTALACDGATTAAVSVVDVAAERRRQEAEMQAQLARQRAQREAAEREARLAQERVQREAAQRQQEIEAQARAVREKEAEVRRLAEQRERDLAERAETVRRLELEAAVRERALEERENAARQPARAAKRAPAGQASAGSSKPAQKPAKPSASPSTTGTLDAF
jgi:hypothetical protein